MRFWSLSSLSAFLFSGVFMLASGRVNAGVEILSPDTIFKRYKSAVVRIEVTLDGASLAVGSGFFISKQGEIATSLHVIRPFLNHRGTRLEIKLATGEVFKSFEVGACGDARGLDLCLLKIKHTPKAILSLNSGSPDPGERVVAIGHPRNLDFSISTGIVSARRQHPSGWGEVQIDAAISPGNSGGPIIDSRGQAIGVVYQFERDGQNLNFAVSADEISKLRSKSPDFYSAARAKEKYLEQSTTNARAEIDQKIRPAILGFLKTTSLAITGVKWMRVNVGDGAFWVLLPEFFSSCEKSNGEDGSFSTVCSSAGGDVIVTLQRRPRSLKGPLSKYSGRRLVEARPLAVVERLESEGTWDPQTENFSRFQSLPSVARCTSDRRQMSFRKDGFFQKSHSTCRFETENDSDPGAISASQWLEMKDGLYGINVWGVDPGRREFLRGLTDLIAVSAGSKVDAPVIRYPVRQPTSFRSRP